MRYEDGIGGLQRRQNDLLVELQEIQDASDRLVALENTQADFEEEFPSHKWESLKGAKDRLEGGELAIALELAEKRIADSDIPLNYFSNLRSAIDGLKAALQLVDKRIAGYDVPLSYSSILRSTSDRLTTALRLVDQHAAYSKTPLSHFARLDRTSKRLTEALRLANKHVNGSDTLLGRISLWCSTGRDRRRIHEIASNAVRTCPSLRAPVSEESFEAWRKWLTEALAEIETLQVASRDQRLIKKLTTEVVADCQMLEPCPVGDQTFQAWREWLGQALSDTEQFKAIIKDREQIHSLASEAAAICPSLPPRLAVDQSFSKWRDWITQALSAVENLQAIDRDRKRIQGIAIEATAACSVLDPRPPEDSSFQHWESLDHGRAQGYRGVGRDR